MAISAGCEQCKEDGTEIVSFIGASVRIRSRSPFRCHPWQAVLPHEIISPDPMYSIEWGRFISAPMCLWFATGLFLGETM